MASPRNNPAVIVSYNRMTPVEFNKWFEIKMFSYSQWSLNDAHKVILIHSQM